MKPLSLLLPALLLCLSLPETILARVSIVENGKARAVVVTADSPSPMALYAAQELIEHVKKATGATLPQTTEGSLGALSESTPSRIFVGVTRQAASQGIDVETLRNDDAILRTVGNDLYILGKENPKAEPFGWAAEAAPGTAGTLFGVYEILEEHLGVRWLWPGELGTAVPKTDRFEIADIDRSVSLRLRDRRFSYSHLLTTVRDRIDRVLSFGFASEANVHRYLRDLEIFLRRHRAGSSDPRPFAGHFFTGWWEKHGRQHPDWFMMRADGKRGPAPGDRTDRVAMCVSNPELHRYIVNEYWDGKTPLKLGEVDSRLACQCPECLAWDGEQPDLAGIPKAFHELYLPRMTSNRYARFWKAIHDLALQRNPKVQIATQLYLNYSAAPTSGIQLTPAIYGQFVPHGVSSGYFWPMTAEENRWYRQQWKGWADTGMSMIWRPNHLHAYYVMPEGNTRQVGEFIRFAAQNGMVGAWFDSLFAHWSTLGPMYYLHFRLIADPTLEVADVQKEFFSAFGPAVDDVARYFDYWEAHAATRERGREYALKSIVKKPFAQWYLNQIGDPHPLSQPEVREIDRETVEISYIVNGAPELRRPVGAHLRYPQSVYPPAEALLEKAMQAVRNDPNPEYAARVRFLQDGLVHARLSAEIWRDLDYDLSDRNGAWGAVSTDPQKRAKTERALRELIAFRHAHQRPYLADYIAAAYREHRIVGWQTILGDTPKPIPVKKAPGKKAAKTDALEVMDATE